MALSPISPPLGQSKQNHLQAIDALRGLAAIVVLFYHARVTLWVGLGETWRQYGLQLNPDVWLGYASAPLMFGGLAVDLFFVLSGYCIHRRGARQLASDPKNELRWKQFAIRRIWRLYPTYVVALIITGIIDTYIVSNHSAQLAVDVALSPVTFITSLLALPGILAPYFGSNGVFWTLAMEIHFYVVYPILFYISRQYGPLRTLSFALVISLTYSILDLLIGLNNLLPYRGSFNPIFLPYWFTWTFGFYLAEVEAGRAALPKNWRLLSLISMVITLLASVLKFYTLKNLASALFFGGVIYWSITPQGGKFWGTWLGQGFSRVGTFSYSLYAFHVPFLLMFKYIVLPNGQRLTTFTPVLLACFLVTLASYFAFLLVEKWTLKPIFQTGK